MFDKQCNKHIDSPQLSLHTPSQATHKCLQVPASQVDIAEASDCDLEPELDVPASQPATARSPAPRRQRAAAAAAVPSSAGNEDVDDLKQQMANMMALVQGMLTAQSQQTPDGASAAGSQETTMKGRRQGAEETASQSRKAAHVDENTGRKQGAEETASQSRKAAHLDENTGRKSGAGVPASQSRQAALARLAEVTSDDEAPPAKRTKKGQK